MSQHWSVSWHLDPDAPLIFGDDMENKVGQEAMGYTNSGMQEITSRGEPACSFHAERDTLMHEAMHAIFNMTGLDSIFSDVDAEDYVSRLTPAILTLLRDNPGLVEYLTEKEADHD